MPKRNLAKLLTRLLTREGLPHTVAEPFEEAESLSFELDAGPSTLHLSALTFGGDAVVFVVQTGLEIPEDRLNAVVEWVLFANAAQGLATFLLDLEHRALAVRYGVDCRAIPTPALDAVLPRAWNVVAEIWRDFAPQLLEVLAGQVGTDDELDDEDDDELDAAADFELDEETAAEMDEAWDAAVGGLTGLLQRAVSEHFGDDVADALDAALGEVAATYLERSLEDAAETGELPATADVDIRVKGGDEGAVVTMSAGGTRPLRYRFSPRQVRERAQADARGLTLYYHARPADAPRVLGGAFADEAVEMRSGYTSDAQGVPIDEGDSATTTGVPLASQPLPRDDRGDRTVTVRVTWDADAPSLAEYERGETAFEGAEAWTIEPTARRWIVPAEVLNAAVRDQLATVSVVE